MYEYVNERNGKWLSLFADDVYEIIKANVECFDVEIVYDCDFEYDYFGYKIFECLYLL